MTRTILAVIALCALCAAGCGSATRAIACEREAAPRASAAYAVGAGDVLQVNVWQNADLTTRVTVRPDGFITMPLIGEVRAEGMRPNQLQEEISRRLTRFLTTAAAVTVTVAEFNSYRVYVLGQVTTPGEFRPTAAVTVLQALSLAGGVTRFAEVDDIVVVRLDRRGAHRCSFDHSAVVERGRLQENILLRSGDTVVVP